MEEGQSRRRVVVGPGTSVVVKDGVFVVEVIGPVECEIDVGEAVAGEALVLPL